jgi:hypothetical protein
MPFKSRYAFARTITISLLLAVASCADLSVLQPDPSPSDMSEGSAGSGEDSVVLDFQGFPIALSPGTDSCRGFSWEPTIAVDPNNEMT